MSDSVELSSVRGILPARDSRSLVVGASGSGKSLMTKALARHLVREARLIVTDPKAEWYKDNPGARRLYTRITRPEELRWEFRYPILFQPPAIEFDNPDIYDPIFQIAWKRANLTVINDEIMFMGSRPTRYMRAIMAQGRSRSIRIINGTQRPANIPLVTITEANTLYAFYLSDKDDIRRIRQMIPEYDPDALGKFEFWFKRLGQPAIKLYYDPTT